MQLNNNNKDKVGKCVDRLKQQQTQTADSVNRRYNDNYLNKSVKSGGCSVLCDVIQNTCPFFISISTGKVIASVIQDEALHCSGSDRHGFGRGWP